MQRTQPCTLSVITTQICPCGLCTGGRVGRTEWTEIKCNKDTDDSAEHKEEVQRVGECGCELKGQEVAQSRKVKYLGVWVDEGLTWVDHVEAVRRKCLGGLAKLRTLRDIPCLQP